MALTVTHTLPLSQPPPHSCRRMVQAMDVVNAALVHTGGARVTEAEKRMFDNFMARHGVPASLVTDHTASECLSVLALSLFL